VFQTLLVATDGSPAADGALAYAAGLAEEQTGRLVVVHVAELVPGRSAQVVRAPEDDVVRRIRGQVASLADAGIDARFELREAVVGGPSREIARIAEQVGADLVVIGTVGQTPGVGVLQGSVAQHIAHFAPCPILIVPTGGSAPLSPAAG